MIMGESLVWEIISMGETKKRVSFSTSRFMGQESMFPVVQPQFFTSVYFWLFMSPINPNLPE